MVPEGWKPTKLGDISSLVTSGSRDWAKFYSDSGSMFIRMTNLRRDGIHLKMNDLKFVNIESDSADGKRTSLQAGDILISITAELGKIGWVPPGLGEAYINQHTALVRVKPTKSESKFVAYLLSSKPYHRRINALNDAGAKAGLNLATIRSLPIALPTIPEQKKIAQILSTWDQAITATERLLENSQQRKKGLMQQLLTGKKRLPGFEGEWKKVELGEALAYQQPTPFLVTSTEYSDDFPTPVLTAGKSFLLGYTNETFGIYDDGLPVIIFDDFTTASQFVDFPFKAKSSAMKILTAKPGYSIRFIFEAMRMIRFAVGGHQRHWISIFANLVIPCPSSEEQHAISEVCATADREISSLQARLDSLKSEKKALMQQLLTGKRRVQVDTEAA